MNSVKYKDEIYEIRPIKNLRDLVNGSAELYGEANAFLVKDTPGGTYRPISYIQFKEDVDALGTALIELGLLGKKIALIGENRYEWVVSYLATVNGTGTIVPLDRELPASEIRHLLERAEVSAVIYSGKIEMTLEEALKGDLEIEFLISMDADENEGKKLSMKRLLDRGRKLLKGERRTFVDAKIDPEAMNMLLFTSGTTGMAKGVMLSHKNICANVMNMSKFVNVQQNDVGLSVLPMHHTYEFTCHILTASYQGCCIAICEGLRYIVKNMAEAQASVMLGVPLIFESMHKKVWKKAESSGQAEKLRAAVQIAKKLNKFNLKILKKMFKSVQQAMGGHMRILIVGAAAIDPLVIEDFNAMGITMFQGYGMTESAPIIAVNKDRYWKPASAGLPMPGTEIRLEDCDENGVGEIICRSDSVMIGYYENPEETAKVLVDGWLHTGDYGYFDKDGFLYISGRKKNVIVTKNGKNIFPEEVEFYLSKCDYIAEVMVSGIEDEKSGETIVYADIYPDFSAVEEQNGRVTPEGLNLLLKKAIDEINEQMPIYKRVRRFDVRTTEFEKTTTKKIKRYTVKQEEETETR